MAHDCHHCLVTTVGDEDKVMVGNIGGGIFYTSNFDALKWPLMNREWIIVVSSQSTMPMDV